MHFLKKSSIIVSIFVLIILINAVNAADNQTQILDDDNIEISQARQINVSSNDFQELSDAIYDSNDGDVIEIDGEYVKNKYQTEINDKSITLQGSEKGATINCNSSGQLFFLKNSSLTLKI